MSDANCETISIPRTDTVSSLITSMIDPTVVPASAPITPDIIIIRLSGLSTLNSFAAPVRPFNAPIAIHVLSLAARPMTVAPKPAVTPNMDEILAETSGKNF